jgi:bacterioferritin (cytochrome b1)
MGTAQSPEAIREELRVVEEDLARLREAVTDLRTRLQEGWNEPTDAEERTVMIEAVEEQEALISELETRREQLRQRLGER